MAYAPMPVKAAADTITLANYNTAKADFEATGVAIVTTKGDIPAATGNQALARLAIGAAGSKLVPDAGEATGLAWQIQPAVRVYNDADSTPGTLAWVTVTFNTERWDTDAMHSTLANTDRLTVPAGGDGIYHIFANVRFGTNVWNDDEIGLQLLLNGGTVIQQHLEGQGWANADMGLGIATDYSLVATDYVVLQVWTKRAIDIIHVGNYSPEFGATWQRVAP